MENLELEKASLLSEENIDLIRSIFSTSNDISQARKSLTTEPKLTAICEEFRFKTEEKNKNGKCLITLSRKDGTGKDIFIPVHLRKIGQDTTCPPREILLLHHH